MKLYDLTMLIFVIVISAVILADVIAERTDNQWPKPCKCKHKMKIIVTETWNR